VSRLPPQKLKRKLDIFVNKKKHVWSRSLPFNQVTTETSSLWTCLELLKQTLCVVGVDAGNAVTPSTGPPTADGVLYILTGAMERYRLCVTSSSQKTVNLLLYVFVTFVYCSLCLLLCHHYVVNKDEYNLTMSLLMSLLSYTPRVNAL